LLFSAEAEVHDILESTSMEELWDGANRGLGLDSEEYAAWLCEPNLPQVALDCACPSMVWGSHIERLQQER